MNEEQRLRTRLEAVDVPPTSVEVAAVIRAGRRIAVRRRATQAAGGVALVASVLLAVPAILSRVGVQPAVQVGKTADRTSTAPSTGPARTTAPASSVASCQMTKLPVPSGMTDATADAVDPTGRYAVGNSTVGEDFRAILWTGGQPRALPLKGKSVQATAVNASGVVVGIVTNAPTQESVFRYENGAYTMLQAPRGNWNPFPSPAINAAGDVVVNVEPIGNVEGKGSIALLWKAGSTIAVKLPLPAGANVFAIEDDGTLVGTTYKDGVGVAGYAWDQRGGGRKLAEPAGQTTAAYAARGDWAAGGVWPAMSAALWNLRTGAVTTLGAPGLGPGDAVNTSGWVVAGGSVLRAGGSVKLVVPGGQTSRATGLSDTGLVVGQSIINGRNGVKIVGPRMWRC